MGGCPTTRTIDDFRILLSRSNAVALGERSVRREGKDVLEKFERRSVGGIQSSSSTRAAGVKEDR